MTIKEMCRRSYEIAVSKGWHEQERSFGEAVALFHSEVSEALECYRDPSHRPGDVWRSDDGKPEGVVIELADLLIRIGDTVEDMKIPVDVKMVNHRVFDLGLGFEGKLAKTILEQLADIHMSLSLAYQASMLWHVPEGGDTSNYLADALEKTGYLCRSNGWDLENAVIEKMEHNASRSHRHGGKRA
jgi:hypothetical protein